MKKKRKRKSYPFIFILFFNPKEISVFVFTCFYFDNMKISISKLSYESQVKRDSCQHPILSGQKKLKKKVDNNSNN